MRSSLSNRTALVVGAGGLGGAAALALASSGAGRVVLVDDATVEPTDLTGHPLHVEADLGRGKAAAAAQRLGQAFPALRVEAVARPLDLSGAPELLRGVDVVVDASSHFPTMFGVNDAAVAAGTPLVHGALLGFTAQLLTVMPGQTGCLRCLFEGPPPPAPPGALVAGPLGPLAGLAGALMGCEAARLLGGGGGAYAGRLLVHEARTARSRTVPVRRRTGCAACGHIDPAPAPRVGA